MTDESLELHTAAIYALNLSHTGDLGIHVHVGLCLHSRAVDGMKINVCVNVLMLDKIKIFIDLYVTF